jgi:hypothetical protein
MLRTRDQRLIYIKSFIINVMWLSKCHFVNCFLRFVCGIVRERKPPSSVANRLQSEMLLVVYRTVCGVHGSDHSEQYPVPGLNPGQKRASQADFARVAPRLRMSLWAECRHFLRVAHDTASESDLLTSLA